MDWFLYHSCWRSLTSLCVYCPLEQLLFFIRRGQPRDLLPSVWYLRAGTSSFFFSAFFFQLNIFTWRFGIHSIAEWLLDLVWTIDQIQCRQCHLQTRISTACMSRLFRLRHPQYRILNMIENPGLTVPAWRVGNPVPPFLSPATILKSRSRRRNSPRTTLVPWVREGTRQMLRNSVEKQEKPYKSEFRAKSTIDQQRTLLLRDIKLFPVGYSAICCFFTTFDKVDMSHVFMYMKLTRRVRAGKQIPCSHLCKPSQSALMRSSQTTTN